MAIFSAISPKKRTTCNTDRFKLLLRWSFMRMVNEAEDAAFSNRRPDSCSQNQNFTSLLTSQLPLPHHYGLGSSQVHGLESSSPTAEREKSSKRESRIKWSPTEDVVLCSAWLNTSKDCIIGNEHKQNAFWKRIGAYFNASPNLAGFAERDPGKCKQRWAKINESVCKFVGCYDSATRQRRSGESDDDVMSRALELYLQDHKSNFKLQHCWLELRHDQKWTSAATLERSKRKKVDDEAGSTTVEGGGGEAEARPQGVKAAKAVEKKKKKKTPLDETESECSIKIQAIQSMFEIRQQDHALKKERSKTAMLESLLAKNEPLSELELTLKDRLIMDFLESV